MSGEMARVWDGRRVKWFFIDNEIIDTFKLSDTSDSLYMKLCRHANNQNGESRPSLRKWATEKRIGWEKLKAAADELIEKKLIKVIKEEHGKPKIYVILDVKGDSTSETPLDMSDSAPEAPQRHRDSKAETPPPLGDSTSEHKQNSLQNLKKTTNAPEGDSRKSPPAQRKEEDRSRSAFSIGPPSKHPELESLDDETLHKQGYFRTHNGQIKKKADPEAVDIFKALANGVPKDNYQSEENEAKTVRYNCKGCGVITEFPSDDDAMEGKCRNCGEPIFKEEEKAK